MTAQILIFMNQKRRPIRVVIEGLARREERFLKPDGTVNAKQLAKAIKVSQPTISRALRGGPNYVPRSTLVDALVNYFGITPAQARGEEGFREAPRDRSLSHDARWIAEQLDPNLSPEEIKAVRRIVQAMIDAKGRPPAKQRRSG